MKKFAVLLCMGSLMLGMTACGNQADKEIQGGTQTESSATESSVPESSATESSVQENSSGEGTGSGASGNDTDVMGSWSEEMQAVKDAVVEQLGDDYWPDSAMNGDMLESFFGVTADMYDDFMAEMPMISANVDTLVVVKAKDGKADAVETALKEYQQQMVEDTMQYPMNLPKIQASKVEKIGNYVCYVQLGADASEESEEDAIKQCQEANDKAIEAIKSVVE